MSEAVDQADDRKWWSKALLVGSVVGIVALPVGALGTKFGIWPFTVGFMLLAVGAVLGAAILFLGIIGAVLANARGWSQDRRSCLIGVAISVVVVGLLANQFITASSVPPIHNISTDTSEPPEFDKLVAIREAEGANPLEYTAEVGEAQRAAYPSIKSLVTPAPADQMFARAVAAIEGLGMELVNEDAAGGVIEATDTTFWFGFKDDVVVRIRAEASGSVVDVRSVSRVGQSDLGKNAQRIGEILAALQAG